MSVYSVKGRGWRYDFTLRGERHTEAWFKTKKEAVQAEAKRKEELNEPKPAAEEIPIDMVFLDLLNLRLDFVKAYKTRSYFDDNRYLFQRLSKKWGKLKVCEIATGMVQTFILNRAKDSHYAANYDLRLLKALFNHAVRLKVIKENPVVGIPFLPVDKKTKFVPSAEDIDKVIAVADPDTQDYLWVIRETMGRMGEINGLTWDDVDLDGRYVILYTRKKKGGSRTPRKVGMTRKLLEVLSRRYASRDPNMPWVFWHTYHSSKTGELKQGPYQDRKRFMKTLCTKAGVKYFRFHALRHSGASIMENNNVPIGSIQKILEHENRSTTEIYLHTIGEAERVAISIYERAREKSHTESHTNEKRVTAHTLQPSLN